MSWDDQLNALKARGLVHAAICDVNGASWIQASAGSGVSKRVFKFWSTTSIA